MHTLFTRPETGGFAVHATLEQSGVEYKLVTINKGDSGSDYDDFTSLSILGQVPVLKLPDGSAMTESAAMMIYLGDLNPESGLCPSPRSPLRSEYLRWLVFGAANLYMPDLRYYYPDRYTTDPTGIEAVKQAALAEFDNNIRVVDQSIGNGPFLLGDTWSGADIYIAMLTFWHPKLPVCFENCPNVKRMCKAVSELDCVKTANVYHNNW